MRIPRSPVDVLNFDLGYNDLLWFSRSFITRLVFRHLVMKIPKDAAHLVNVLVDNLEIEKLNSVNLKAATSAALLLLPSKFCEKELYAKVCSLSYMGDLRMLFAEDKNKSLPPDFLTVLRTE
ncbi:hypothetical protein ACS0TY_003442 [Phlomoides rotata]